MGKLVYGPALSADFDDRVLAHLQIVIGAKLRRGESFYLSWKDDARIGDGRTSIWMHASLHLVFKYYGGKPPAINRQWIHALEELAGTAAGLHVIPEPTGTATA
jgi:hypothetical protein